MIDGEALIWRIPWKGPMAFGRLCEIYVTYALEHFSAPVVILNGYHGPATKDETHERRRGKRVCSNMMFTNTSHVNVQKKPFLDNQSNKQRFIELLARTLEKAGIQCIRDEVDADYRIAKFAAESAQPKPTVVVSDDTDCASLAAVQHRPPR